MGTMKRFSMILALGLVTACGPVVHHAGYQAPAGHLSGYATYSQPGHQYTRPYQRIRPIEVTLFADNLYMGDSFRPIHLIIGDGEYVEIPVRDRRGRDSRIFAHYSQRSLHFDRDRNHRAIHGATRYDHDNRWNKGHKYSRINVGNDYDLSGLRLQIRKTSPDYRHTRKNSSVRVINKKVIHKQQRPEQRHAERSSGKLLTTKKKIVKIAPKTVSRSSKRAVVVEKTTNRSQVKRVTTRLDRVARQNRKNERKTVISYSPVSDARRQVVVKKKDVVKKRIVRDRQSKKRTVVTKVNMQQRSERKDQVRDRGPRKGSVRVSFAGGTVTIDGRQGKIKKSSVTLRDGESRKITLVTKRGKEIKVPISYRNGTLKVSRGGQQFSSDRSWAKGKTYKINTEGASRLDNVRLTVRTN